MTILHQVFFFFFFFFFFSIFVQNLQNDRLSEFLILCLLSLKMLLVVLINDNTLMTLTHFDTK